MTPRAVGPGFMRVLTVSNSANRSKPQRSNLLGLFSWRLARRPESDTHDPMQGGRQRRESHADPLVGACRFAGDRRIGTPPNGGSDDPPYEIRGSTGRKATGGS